MDRDALTAWAMVALGALVLLGVMLAAAAFAGNPVRLG